MIKKLKAFDCLRYSPRWVKCEWPEAKKKKLMKVHDIAE